MKNTHCYIVGFLFVLVFSNLTIAQTEKIQTADSHKIAKIDTDVFADKERGIKMPIQAENSYSIEYYAQISLNKRIIKLKEEINHLISQNESINEKYIELQKLTVELNTANDATKAETERKFTAVVAPIVKKINEKIKEFAKLKGYVLILDKYSSAFLIEGEIVDATFEFIEFCNKSFDKEKSK